ncbi:hypothetical protein NEOLEDRAFT_1143163 [Neolentinus lepideus HHB14362 ss-1]|uniref:Uncharacterized protein n=1 Tax=Neolentinus lepideus HHB14362 ss-1 TaxID=1314782 RepID=A0A165MP40_9AGAM|nr:hypothetical protein NEOLEDRAFT_1143163 [Neolentinus lepideus HHB14362 ss-1]
MTFTRVVTLLLIALVGLSSASPTPTTTEALLPRCSCPPGPLRAGSPVPIVARAESTCRPGPCPL